MGSLLLGCVAIWSYELGSAGHGDRTIQQTLELRVCEDSGRRALSAVRVMKWTDGRTLAELPELQLPWGGAAGEPPAKPP